MYHQGISGAGDISNTGITLSIKQNSRIQYHTFVEVFGLDKEPPRSDLGGRALHLAKAFNDAGLSHSISPMHLIQWG